MRKNIVFCLLSISTLLLHSTENKPFKSKKKQVHKKYRSKYKKSKKSTKKITNKKMSQDSIEFVSTNQMYSFLETLTEENRRLKRNLQKKLEGIENNETTQSLELNAVPNPTSPSSSHATLATIVTSQQPVVIAPVLPTTNWFSFNVQRLLCSCRSKSKIIYGTPMVKTR